MSNSDRLFCCVTLTGAAVGALISTLVVMPNDASPDAKVGYTVAGSAIGSVSSFLVPALFLCCSKLKLPKFYRGNEPRNIPDGEFLPRRDVVVQASGARAEQPVNVHQARVTTAPSGSHLDALEAGRAVAATAVQL